MAARTVPAAATAVLTAALISCLLIPAIDANTSVSNNNKAVEWQLLSAKNFSSQIHIHPHVLLLVTVPWCGESRSFMRKISLKLAEDQQKYSSLKLMLLHRNVDKVLADSLGAVDEVTVLYYHHAVSYKYQGSLRVPDILSSVDYLLSVVPEELPLRKVNNLEDMEMFLESTDKAVLLLETCGWTSKLLAELTANKGLQDNLALQVLRDLNKERNRTQAFGGKKYLKHNVGSEMIIGEDEVSFGGSPWIGEFSAMNGTSFSQDEDTQADFGKSCSFTEFKKFESFFSKFIAAARDSYLPPQRQKYAFVSDRFLLSPLSVEVSDVWSLIISYAGCPGCAMKFKEEAYLRHALEMNDQPVIELLVDEKDIGPSLPIDKPSIVLFVDRTSESKETVKQSQEALLVFKEFAQQKQKLQQTDGRSREWTRKKLHTIKGSAGTYRGSRLVISSASDKKKDKLSVVIIKDGKYVTLDNKALDLKGSSFHEILTHVLGQKKHSKLSSLAKETGFQLLSDDIDIKITDALSHQMGIDIPDSAESSDEVTDSNVINSAPVAEVEHFQPASVGPHDDGEHKSSVDLASDHTGLVDSHQSYTDFEVSSVHVDSEIQASLKAGKSESLEHHHDYFNGSFFFSDGNNKLLRSLTNDLKVPSIVIVDPVSQQHYVFSEETPLKLSSLSIFMDHFINGSLVPYQRSGPWRKVSEMAHPPFVNLDFQEKDSIPSISTKIFSELVTGTSQSDAHNSTHAWRKDVMVLFSSSWCGFCQRMELVVREAYRALKGSVDLVKCDSESEELCSEDNFKDVISKLPAVYLMDCTSNDCRWILKSMGQREVYPTLLLFPANTKAIIPFDGNMIVTDIIKFLANHGVGSEYLAKQKGTLRMDGAEDHNSDVYRVAFPMEFSPERNNHDGGAFTDTMSQNQVTHGHDRTEASWKLVVGSFLVASERLNGVNPFSEAKILIVSTDTDLGVLGLIINKPISWSNVLESEDYESLREAPLSFGGPVMQEGMPLVSLMRSSLNLQYPEVIPGIYFLDQSATINKIEEIKARNQSALDCWFFWGYSGWSWEQLYNEITDDAWKVLEGSIEDLQWP